MALYAVGGRLIEADSPDDAIAKYRADPNAGSPYAPPGGGGAAASAQPKLSFEEWAKRNDIKPDEVASGWARRQYEYYLDPSTRPAGDLEGRAPGPTPNPTGGGSAANSSGVTRSIPQTLTEQFGEPFAFRQWLQSQLPSGTSNYYRGVQENLFPDVQMGAALRQLGGQNIPDFQTYLSQGGNLRPSASEFQDLLRRGAAGLTGSTGGNAPQEAGVAFFTDDDSTSFNGTPIGAGLNRQYKAALAGAQAQVSPMFRGSLANLGQRQFEEWLARTRGKEDFLPGFVNRGFTFR